MEKRLQKKITSDWCAWQVGNKIRFCSEQFGKIDLVYDFDQNMQKCNILSQLRYNCSYYWKNEKRREMPIRQSFVMKMGLLEFRYENG